MPREESFVGPPPSEYFERKQQQYVRQVSKGRHPRSFPRESELQYFAITTGARLAKIRAGHNTWHVLKESSVNEDKEEDKDFEEEASYGVAASSLAVSEYAAQEASSSSLVTAANAAMPLPPTTPANAAAAAANFGSVLINGMQIDIRNKTQLHYGQMVVVMGEKNSIVCVSQETNEIKLKPQESVLPTDRTLFKLIDLRDSTNPHAVKYGEPLWLQIIDVSGNPGTLYGWNQAVALCSKLFDLHETDTKHLNPNWEKHALRDDVLRRSSYQPEDKEDGEEKDDANNAAAGPASSSSSASASGGAGAGAKRQSKGWGKLRGKLPRGGAGAGAVVAEAAQAPEIEGGNKDGAAPSSSGPASSASTAAANSNSSSSRGGGGAGRGAGGGGRGQHARREHEPEAVICGGSQAVLIGAMALQAKKKLDEELSTMPGASKVASREAWIMGQVALHAAERPGGHDHSQGKSKSKAKGEAQAAVGQLGDVALSNTPLYMAQDIYCFASSAGSAWSTWPLKSNEIAPPMDLSDPRSPQGSPAGKAGGGGGGGGVGRGHGADDDDKSVHSHVSGKSHASHASHVSHASLSSSVASLAGKVAPPAESAIVMRKLLAKRAPHEYVVDKRCVFRFCPVDNVSDTSQLSQQEIHAQKLQAKAKAGLRRSEITRKGGRVYPSSDGDVVPIPCGEKFSLRLRQNVSTKELRSLGEQLLPRRDKEKVIKEHFLAYCGSDWDRGDDNDSVSVASLSIVKQPIASLLSAARSVGGGYGGGGSLDGGPSLGSLSVDESLGQPSADLGPGPSLAAPVQRVRVSLPPDHTQAHEASQKALLEQSQRSKVLRPYHYNNFPNYYKTVAPTPGTVIRPRVLNYNDPRLSDGETVVSLRQALQGISGRVVHDMSLAAALDAVSGPGQRRRDITPLNPARPDVMSKIHAQNELIEMSLDHLDRLKALTEVTNARQNFTI